MAKYRHDLPLMNDKIFLTDGGLETILVYRLGFDLPHFAAFDRMRKQNEQDFFQDYIQRYAKIALDSGYRFILETPTWRANSDWATLMGYSPDALRSVNQEYVDLLVDIRGDIETNDSPMVVSGCIGPRRDGYAADEIMTIAESASYHGDQIGYFASSDADIVSALTMTNIPEAAGIARSANAANMPVAISFTVETDGRLPTGHTLREAIETVDAETNAAPAYYMINCAHPTHFMETLDTNEAWARRLKGLRANASSCSHAELDNAEHLDDGDPVALGVEMGAIQRKHPHINVLGGCCGTDHRHIEQIATSITPQARKAA